jgi:hypothetical protein
MDAVFATRAHGGVPNPVKVDHMGEADDSADHFAGAKPKHVGKQPIHECAARQFQGDGLLGSGEHGYWEHIAVCARRPWNTPPTTLALGSFSDVRLSNTASAGSRLWRALSQCQARARHDRAKLGDDVAIARLGRRDDRAVQCAVDRRGLALHG